MYTRTVSGLASTPTGEALREDVVYYETQALRLQLVQTPAARDRHAHYAALAARAREAIGRIEELDARLCHRQVAQGA